MPVEIWNPDGENLRRAKDITVAQLREAHLARRMPAHLAEIIHLAGQADVGIVIFDADVPVSDDLPIFDE